MKQATALLLACSMIFGLASCSPAESGMTDPNPSMTAAPESEPAAEVEPSSLLGEWTLEMTLPDGTEPQTYRARLESDGTLVLLGDDGGPAFAYAYELDGGTLVVSDPQTGSYCRGTYTAAGDILAFAVTEYAGWEEDSTSEPPDAGPRIRAMRDGKYGFVDEADQVQIPFAYDDAGEFSEGLCRVRVGNDWGFIDTRGELVIPCQYREAGDFSGGLAPVELVADGKTVWGCVDLQGELVIEPVYEELYQCQDGLLAARKNGYWGFLAPDGSTAVEFLYTDLAGTGFSHGRAAVGINNAWGVIGTDGAYLLPLNSQTNSLVYDGAEFFQMGSDIYNAAGELLREEMDIWYADGTSGRCMLTDGDEIAEIIDTAGNAVTDLRQLAAKTLPEVRGEIGIHLISFSDRNWKQNMTGRNKIGTYELTWDGWMLIEAKDAGLAPREAARSLYLNLINLQGELFWEEWRIENYQQETSDRCSIEMYDHYVIVSDFEQNCVEVWDLETGACHSLPGEELNDGRRWRFDNMTLWGDYLITQPKTGDDGNRFVSIFSLATLSDPYRAASVQAIDDRYLRVCDMEGVFWGVLSNADGVLTEVFPREYTNIEYENYGEEEGNLLLERGAEQVRYWIGPHGNFIPA